MLTTKFIKENRESVLESLKKRNLSSDQVDIVDAVILMDEQRRSLQTVLDAELNSLNNYSKEIGQLFKDGRQAEALKLKKEVVQIKGQSKEKEEQLRQLKSDLNEKLLNIPNIAHPSVKPGLGEKDNETIQDFGGVLPELDEKAMAHWDLADKYNLIDFKTGAKLTGSGFPVFIGKGAKLQRSLVAFFLDQATESGYLEVIPPLVVNEDSALGTGQLPDKEGQMYHIQTDNLYLIPTSEVPLTNIYRNVILEEGDFPIKMTAYTPCFRREAGSYGSDVKGLNRVHQFDKVEIVRVEHPDRSYHTLDEMVKYVEGLLQKLELPYRIMRLCGGDLGFASALTYDFEVYSAGQKRWLEVSSVSNYESFQSNRMKLRFKDSSNKTRLAHTLNGSALALPRIMAALLENNQVQNGINIPEVLQSYTGFHIIQ